MTTLIGWLVVTLVTLSKKEKEEKIETRSKNKQKILISKRSNKKQKKKIQNCVEKEKNND